MNWQLVLGLPCLGPQMAGMDSDTPATQRTVVENGRTVILLFALSFPRILCHVHLRDFANVVEFRFSPLPGRRRLIFSILAPNVQKRLCCFECRSIQLSWAAPWPSRTWEHVIKMICLARWLHHVFFLFDCFVLQPFTYDWEISTRLCFPFETWRGIKLLQRDVDDSKGWPGFPCFPFAPSVTATPPLNFRSLFISSLQLSLQCTRRFADFLNLLLFSFFPPPPRLSLYIINILCALPVYSDHTSQKIKQTKKKHLCEGWVFPRLPPRH